MVLEEVKSMTHQACKSIVVPEEHRSMLVQLPLNEQYAHLMALGDEQQYGERYALALRDFPRLCAIEGVEYIGINWNKAALLLGTEYIVVEDCDGTERDIGHILITITQRPSAYKIDNITKTVSAYASGRAAHPHAFQGGQLCMASGNTAVMLAITDGRCSVAAELIVTALRMRKGTVNAGTAYVALSSWPSKEEKSR